MARTCSRIVLRALDLSNNSTVDKCLECEVGGKVLETGGNLEAGANMADLDMPGDFGGIDSDDELEYEEVEIEGEQP